MTRLLIILILATISWSFAGEEERFHKVPATPGDGVYSLLRRYKLDQFSCNHTKFYELNDLSKSSPLKIGRYYTIPILMYDYKKYVIKVILRLKHLNIYCVYYKKLYKL